ncbi:poly-beta-1,6 N-acetyl-D-glucosamine export porin PgaA [Dyella flava]|uniref:Poly-beta-1,6 N-acetyl-D-glucosamine export porin PgaA n=1 Tax=Dyella flava TaxID=1920170 RepID=A0ABS2K3V5_9GAMM|nr:poly-beta-1,6 N-acetyl-D-glucosamine export porin PgaA [Dyella flava]MBM7125928.1 poly-beta-1,6 N-acetyl-D-glucosamine export porin PgaA [Dyella flava]GLQ48556.1 poly-beta-1,6 N-acetyl-D-glucosamine export porin PgaA [Dyella flava]
MSFEITSWKKRKVHVRRTAIALLVMITLYGAAEIVCAQESVQATADAGSLLAQARASQAAGKRVEALAYCQEVLARWPDNPEARQLNVTLLSELGAAARAQELGAELPSNTAQRYRLLADYDAHLVRWAHGEPADAHHPYAEADQAAAAIERLANDPSAPADIRLRARMDMLAVLDQADRAGDVLANYAQLKQQGVQLPPYAEQAVADAMMQKHDSRDAIVLYEDSIRRDPGPYDPTETDPRIGLAYAYLQAGRMQDALSTIHKLADSEARWLHLPNVRGNTQNQRKVDADTSAASVEMDEGLLKTAYDRLAAMSAEAPGNADIRRELAMAELARGWPRRALDTLKIADNWDERDANAALDQAAAHQALYDYADEEADLAQAQQEAGRSGRVQDALSAWDQYRGWQFDLTHDNGWGNSPDYGDRDEETEATLASPLIDNHWRVLALAQYATASLPEGEVARERAGLGLQTYLHGLMFYVEALPSADRFVHRTDVAAGFNWAISDQWTWSTDWSSASNDVPLRAQYYGITGNSVSTAVQWRPSELTSARLALYRDRFTDGNLREGWLADFVQRLHTAPNLTLDGGVEIGGSHNSETDRPYFNPRDDHSYALTGSLQNLLSQYEDRSWNQRIDVAVGGYQELNYGTGVMVSARYGQIFQPRLGLRFGWGVSWHYQPYDGRHEQRVVLDLSMHWGE